jgi:hypothetical protein
MRLSACFLFMCSAISAKASDWQRLDGPGIEAALTGERVEYTNGAIQRFSETGFTEYIYGELSFGDWGVRGGRYCSVWPPSDVWACYDVERTGDRLRFVGDHDDVTEGVLVSQ